MLQGLYTDNLAQLPQVLQWFNTVDKTVLNNFQQKMLQCDTEDLLDLIDLLEEKHYETALSNYINEIIGELKKITCSSVYYNPTNKTLTSDSSSKPKFIISLPDAYSEGRDPSAVVKLVHSYNLLLDSGALI